MSTAQEKILDAAVELFSEQGFEATSIREICSKAEVNVASVNYHYKGKLGLGKAVIEYLFEDYDKQQEVLFPKTEINNSLEWETGLKKFIYNFISTNEQNNPKLYNRSRLIFKELNNPSELFETIYSRYLAPFQNKLIEYIKTALPEDASEEELTMWFITIISQCIMFRKRIYANTEIKVINLSEESNVRLVADHIADTVLCSLSYKNIERKMNR
jgi:AcrR family transcriptional regulator